MAHCSPSKILNIGLAFTASRTLITAVELDLFTVLAAKPLTATQLARTLGLHPRAVPDFPDALVSLELLQRDGDGPEATYSNTEDTAAFLDDNSPRSMRGWLSLLGSRVYPTWNRLPEGLRTGLPQNESRLENGGGDLYGRLYADPDRLAGFVWAMSDMNVAMHKVFAQRFDFGPYETLLDLGGNAGQLSCEVAMACSHMTCTTFDLPAVTQFAEQNVAKRELGDRVQCVAGDFFKDEIPKADVILFGMVLHNHDLERKKVLMKKAFDALPVGGAMVAIEMLIDDERRVRTSGLLMSMHMILENGNAFDYSGRDFDIWTKEIGFTKSEVLQLSDQYFAAIAYK